MLERICAGEMPAKHHIVFRQPDGSLYHEECLTRRAFDGPYTLMYHENEPHRHLSVEVSKYGWQCPVREDEASQQPLRRRHFRSFEVPAGGTPINDRLPVMFNDDVVVFIARPTESDPIYLSNGDGDELFYMHQGSGILRTNLGDVRFERRDYVCIPRGVKYRFILDEGVEQYWCVFEVRNRLFLPKQWRTNTGQFRMDAPFCHRDFRKPEFVGPMDEGIHRFVVKREGHFTEFELNHSPLDVVGWDGSVYPWVFPILNFQPRAGLVHLPPDWHGNFAFEGGLICSFVPRTVDFHPEAIPCPYPHDSVHCDEFLFYAEGNFTSRKGIESGSMSFHPMGVNHGPHPGSYEASIGHKTTSELAVMMDTLKPLYVTPQALDIEDPDYHASWHPDLG